MSVLSRVEFMPSIASRLHVPNTLRVYVGTEKMPGLSHALSLCHPERNASREARERGVEGSRGCLLCHADSGNSHQTFSSLPLRPEQMRPCVAPPALFNFSNRYPALTRWANSCRASGPALLSAQDVSAPAESVPIAQQPETTGDSESLPYDIQRRRRDKRLAQRGTGVPNKPGFGLLGWVSAGKACKEEVSPSGAARVRNPGALPE